MIDCPPTDFLVPSKTEDVSPSAYLQLMKSGEAANIKHARFQPPVIGEQGFGSFAIEYNVAKLVRQHGG